MSKPSCKRLSWDDYFLKIAELTALRSACLSRQVGAVLTVDNRIIATGYNNPPRGIKHCTDICKRKQLNYVSGTGHEICSVIHAELNAILSCATTGTKIQNATLYCTHQPCSLCIRAILNLDINRIVFIHPYPDQLAIDLLQEKQFLLQENDTYSCYYKQPEWF
jgi:dCMP deaminase